MESRLELDTSVLKEKKQIGESLTDLNNLNLFTDEFNLILHKKQNEDEIMEQNMKEQCFVSADVQDEDTLLKNKMFYSEQRTANKDIQQEVDYGNYYMLLGSIFIGLVICCIVFGLTDKKGDTSDDIDINSERRTKERI